MSRRSREKSTALSGGICTAPSWGTLYSTIGLTIGSWLAFVLARWLGLPFVEKVIDPKILRKYDHFMEHRGTLITFILFLIPGFPKDALSYIIGLSHMKTTTFLMVCTAGRLLGTIMLSVSGHCARNDQNIAMVAILGISALIVVLAYYYHEELLHLVRRRNIPEGGISSDRPASRRQRSLCGSITGRVSSGTYHEPFETPSGRDKTLFDSVCYGGR